MILLGFFLAKLAATAEKCAQKNKRRKLRRQGLLVLRHTLEASSRGHLLITDY